MALLVNGEHDCISAYFILLLVCHLDAVVDIAVHDFADGDSLVPDLEVGDVHPESAIVCIYKVDLVF